MPNKDFYDFKLNAKKSARIKDILEPKPNKKTAEQRKKRMRTDFREPVHSMDLHGSNQSMMDELNLKRRKEKCEAQYKDYLDAGGDEAFLPDDMMDMDAVLGCAVAMLGSMYDMKPDDVSGLHTVCLWYAWAYHECKKRGYKWVRDLNGGVLACSKGLDKDAIKQFRQIFKTIGKENMGETFKEIYGTEEN